MGKDSVDWATQQIRFGEPVPDGYRGKPKVLTVFEYARRKYETEAPNTDIGRQRRDFALGTLAVSERIAAQQGLKGVEAFESCLHFLFVSAMTGITRPWSLQEAASELSKARKPSAKEWARDKHQDLLADEYARYKELSVAEQGKRLFRDWTTGVGKGRTNSRGKASPNSDSFASYLREFARTR